MTVPSLPKLSIIMPVLNGERTIEKAILSVIDQHYENVELIILDGGSKDNTVDIIKRYEKYISYWHSEHDGSPTLAINLGIQRATGAYIALLMADDWYEPGIFQRIGATISKHPHADMITCGGRIVSFDEKKKRYVTKQSFATKASLHLSFYNICFAASAICCRFIKKSFYEQIGPYHLYDHQGLHIHSNDKEFLLRAVIYRAKDIFVEMLGHNYLSHPGSKTFSHNQRMDMRLCQEHMAIAELYLTKSGLQRRQRLLLHYWHNEQCTRLVLYHLLQKELVRAMTISKSGIKKYHFIWAIIFGVTSIKILMKRTFRALKRALSLS
jgi:glycosyltransferase involved in cell wall biosynthesis